MAIRNDLTVDWEASPRIITIDAPSDSVSMQDLYDTMRSYEALQVDEAFIISGAGKEPLGGGVLVGLTITLNNAKVAFEARTGPEYIQCSITGGNLVAVDIDNISISAVHPTSFTQIVQANSSSATQTDLKAIQFSSFQNAVWLDPGSDNSGTEYPIGNSEYPVNNFTDGVNIANQRGFDTFNIRESVIIGAGVDISGFNLVGRHIKQVIIDILPEAVVDDVQIENATILGTLDGNTILERCSLSTLSYVNGVINRCVMNLGTIYLGGNEQAVFNECISGVAGNSTPTIDFDGSGQGLVMRNYSGGIQLQGRTGDEPISIDLTSGQIVLAADFGGGNDVRFAGSGRIKDYSNLVDYDDSGLVTGTVTIPSQGYVVVDLESTNSGVIYPTGTIPYPVNNFSDAILLAEKHNISSFKGIGALALTTNYIINRAEFIGLSVAQSLFDFGDYLEFNYLTCKNMSVSGRCTGILDTINCEYDGVTNYTGTSRDSTYLSNVQNTFGSGLSVLHSPAFIGNEDDPVILDLNSVGVVLGISGGDGAIKIVNLASDDTIYIHMSSGSIELDASVTGTVKLYGLAKFIDNTTTATVLNELVNKKEISNSVWNSLASGNQTIGTFGNWMKKILYGSK